MTNDDWTALGTMVTAGVALVSLIFAWLQVHHARALREEQAAPVVVVDFVNSPADLSLVNVSVQNTGLTVAYDVQIQFEPEITSTLDTDDMQLRDSDLLRAGIPTLPPGRTYTALFEQMHQRYNHATKHFDKDGHASRYTVTVRFRNSKGKKYSLTYVLSLDVFTNLTFVETKTIHHLAKDLHRLADDFHRAFSGGPLRVSARDEDYANWARDWQVSQSGGVRPSMRRPQPAGRPSPHKYDHLDGDKPRQPRLRWARRRPAQRSTSMRTLGLPALARRATGSPLQQLRAKLLPEEGSGSRGAK